MGVRYDLGDKSLLFRDDIIADPTQLYAQLRAEAPVWEMPGADTFVVTRADLVTEAVARIDDFSSNLSSLVFRGADGCPHVFDMAPLGDATHVLATADPPVHAAHRKLLQSNLSPANVARFSPDIEAMVDEMLEPLLADGGGDLIATLADPLPMRVITRVMGLPASDTDMLVQLVLDVDAILAGVGDEESMAKAAAAAFEQAAYLAARLEAVRRDATRSENGTLLAVIAAGVDRGEITFEQAVGILTQLLGAGSETTSGLIATAVRQLANDPDLQQQLRDDPELVPVFLEEILRLDGPFRFHYRTTKRPTQLDGVGIPAGARVLLMWAAANLDGDAFPYPERLALDRAVPKSHLAFGRGIHFCIGAPLARLEARIAISNLLEATRAIRLRADAPPRHHANIFVRRMAALPLTVVPR